MQKGNFIKYEKELYYYNENLNCWTSEDGNDIG